MFRRRERWAKWLVCGIGSCMIAGLGGSAWLGDLHGDSPLTNPWFWLEISGDTAAVAWMAIEGIGHYRKARQRHRLGLCEPLVCNRYLLWGLSGMVWIAYNIALVAEYIDYNVNEQWSPPLDLLVSSLGALALAVIWFTFFPPAGYRRWIESASPTRKAGGSNA